jgi:serine O-acetyltransferase
VNPDPQSKEQDQRRHAMASKMGFDSYGVSRGAPDPVAHAINCILDHSQALDARVEKLCQALKSLNSEFKDLDLPELGPCEIGPLADEKLDENQELDKEEARSGNT